MRPGAAHQDDARPSRCLFDIMCTNTTLVFRSHTYRIRSCMTSRVAHPAPKGLVISRTRGRVIRLGRLRRAAAYRRKLGRESRLDGLKPHQVQQCVGSPGGGLDIELVLSRL